MSFACVRGPGHPDRVCDLVAASIVEEYLRRDPTSRANIRVCGGHEVLFVAGEVSSTADFDVSAVARRVLGANGVSSQVEPFVAIEPMGSSWTQALGTRSAEAVTGYACLETPERVPKSVAIARDVARAIERVRTLDAEWFWLGADYEVTVDDQGKVPLVIVRAEQVEAKKLNEVREALTKLVRECVSDAEIRINPAGEETQSGFAKRMGSSGRAPSAVEYGSGLPSNASGAGLHVVHPLNAGAWLARSIARRLVHEGHGRAILLQLTWLPLETRPFFIHARNERGQNVSDKIDQALTDLTKLPSEWLAPQLLTNVLRYPFDAATALPWESE